MQAVRLNGVKVYNITAARSLPSWLSERAKRKAQKAATVSSSKKKPQKISSTHNIDLLQDFWFPSSCSCITMSNDGKFVMASGAYKPQVKVFDTDQLTMKFDRHVAYEIAKVLPLGDDWKKFIALHTNRYIGFHAQFGQYFETRIPVFGRDILYDPRTCDLMAVGMSNEVYRLNLEEGRFMESMVSSNLEYMNTCDRQINGALFAAGGSNGTVEFWDLRTRRSAATLAVNGGGSGADVTRVKFAPVESTHFLTGDAEGLVKLYDLRMPRPLLEKDHQFETPIVSLSFHHSADGPRIVSSCERVVKLWNVNDGKLFTALEPPADDPQSSGRINSACVAQDGSGLIFVGGEFTFIQAFFIPELGPAPRWCSFLDSLTEELEESKASSTNLYGDYKFVTRQELENLGMSHLVGTDLLKDYMHGYFMDIRLYQKARAISDPFEYKKFRQQQIEQKLQAERSSRIALVADDEEQEGNGALKGGKASAQANGTTMKSLADSRFRNLAEDPDFAVDEESAEFKRTHPSSSKKKRTQQQMDDSDDEDDDDSEAEDYAALTGGSKSAASASKYAHSVSSQDAEEPGEEELEGKASDEESESDEEETRRIIRERRRKGPSKIQKKQEKARLKAEAERTKELERQQEYSKIKKFSMAERLQYAETKRQDAERAERSRQDMARRENEQRLSKRRKM